MTASDADLWKALSKIYPVSLTADRYSGSYSSGAWVAQVGVFYDSPRSRRHRGHDVLGHPAPWRRC